MTWAYRDRQWVETILPKLKDLQVESGALGRLLDCEGGIMRASGGFGVGMTTWEFADTVVDLMGDGRWGITGLATLVTPLRELASASGLCIPQPLSVWESDAHFERRKSRSSHPDTLRPIRGGPPPKLQIDSFESWEEYVPGYRIELEIGAYYQNRPGMDREECFTRQLQAAVDLGTRRVWLWSLKNMKANRWTEEIVGEYTGAIQ